MIIMLLPALGTFIIFRKYMRIILINEDLIYSPARIFGQLTYKNKYYNSSYPGTQTTYCFSIDNIKNIEKLDKIVKFEFKKPLEFKPYFKSGFEFGIGKPERPIIKSYSVKVNNPEELINDIKKLRLKK